MTIDPSDDCTFWFTTEYIPSNGAFNWSTRIGSFKFPGASNHLVKNHVRTARFGGPFIFAFPAHFFFVLPAAIIIALYRVLRRPTRYQ
jgi:hypothetical protein